MHLARVPFSRGDKSNHFAQVEARTELHGLVHAAGRNRQPVSQAVASQPGHCQLERSFAKDPKP